MASVAEYVQTVQRAHRTFREAIATAHLEFTESMESARNDFQGEMDPEDSEVKSMPARQYRD